MACVLAINISARDIIASGECGANLTWTLYDDGEIVISGNGEMWDYSSVYSASSGGSVTNAPWGEYIDKLTNLTLGEGVTSVGNSAFRGCKKLTGELKIPKSVTKIGTGAFSGCNCFSGNLVIPNNVVDIGGNAFEHCDGFSGELVIPDSVVTIGAKAFYHIDGFTGPLTIGNGVVSIGKDAFAYCKGLSGSLIIPDNITTIGENAFSGCYGFDGNLSLGSGLTNIERSTFSGCVKLTGTLLIPDNITTIGYEAFAKCVGFNGELKIGNGVTTIEPYAFAYCENLIGHLIIPDSVTKIGNNSFYSCGRLSVLTTQENMVSIGSLSFYGCKNLKKATILSKNVEFGFAVFNETAEDFTLCGYAGSTAETYAVENGHPFSEPDDRILVDFGTCGADVEWALDREGVLTFSGTGRMDSFYVNVRPWKPYKDRIIHVVVESGVTNIGSYALAECNNIETVEISDTVTEAATCVLRIDSNNFVCINVDEANETYSSRDGVLFSKNYDTLICYPRGKTDSRYVVPDNVVTIGNSAFDKCIYLTDVCVSNNVKMIEYAAFRDCTELENVTLGCNVESIRSYAFGNCSALKTITIPYSVDVIEGSAFDGCSALKKARFLSDRAQFNTVEFVNCNEDLTIQCFLDSTAERVATDNGIQFEIIPNFEGSIKKGTAQIDGLCDSEYSVSFQLEGLGLQENSYGTNWSTDTFADVHFLYDNEYLYIFADVHDNNVMSIGSELVYITEEPEKNDGIEFILSFDGTDETFKVGIDAFGYRCYGSMEENPYFDFSEIKYTTTYSDESYTVECAIPCNKEQLSLISTNLLGFTYRLNDIDQNGSYSYHTTSFAGEDAELPVFVELSDKRAIVNPDTIDSGDCGKAVYWKLDETGLLTIYGEGDMRNYNLVMFNPAPWWRDYNDKIDTVVIEDGVTSIGNSAFEDCGKIRSVSIPDTVNKIGDFAFSGCRSLEAVTLPEALETIGESAFQACALTKISIGSNVKQIGSGAFSCYYLKKTYITDIEAWCKMDNGGGTPMRWGGDLYLNGERVEKLIIPSTVDVIKANVFYGCFSIKEIIMPNSVVAIEDGAFNYCVNLQSVDLPESLERIGFQAFKQNDSLEKIIIPNSVNYIGEEAFQSCQKLKKINIRGAVEVIEPNTFSNCPSLESVVIENGLQKIGDSAFLGCRALNEINLPDSLLEIGGVAFSGCESLTTIDIPDSVKIIGDMAFSECRGLIEVKLPNQLQIIEGSTFSACTSLSEIIIPDSVCEIGDWAFSGCHNLQNVSMGCNLTTIGNGLFQYCHMLEKVTIYSTNVTFGEYIFKDASTNFTIYGYPSSTAEVYADANGYKFEILSDKTVVIDSGECGDNLSWTLYSDGNLVISGTGNMWDYAYSSSSGAVAPWMEFSSYITKLTLCDEVSSIGKYAFFSCENISGGFELPKSIVTINDYAFAYCGGLTGELVIPNSVVSIGQAAFINCSGFTGALEIPNSVTSIGTAAFYGCSGFTGVLNIPESITEIKVNTFRDCTGITELIIPESVVKIDNTAFTVCTSLIKATIYSETVTFGTGVFGYLPDDFTIYGYAGSTAEDYANANKHKFVSLNLISIKGAISSYNTHCETKIELIKDGNVVSVVVLPVCDGLGMLTEEFIIEGIERGTYDLVITKAGCLNYFVKNIVVGDDVVDLRNHNNKDIANITLISGDVNGDGCVDLKDVTQLTSSRTYGMAFDEAENKLGDVNGDGCFDLKDLVIITSDKNYGKAPVVVAY